MTIKLNGTTGVTYPDNIVQPNGAPAPGAAGNVLVSNGTNWTSGLFWNVTYVNVSKVDDSSYSLPSNCLGVYVWCETSGSGNNGGIGKVSIKNSGGTTLGYVYVGGTNIGGGADGGSGMRDGVGTFIPVPSTATEIYMETVTNDVNSSWVIQAYITKQ
jgi:hypothetical protein